MLSKQQPSIILFAAFLISAVSSTITGGFPEPAPIAFLPEFKSVFINPGPPVPHKSFIEGVS
ncbi:hypothetical protein LL033_14615 [Clostridium estertheticum]|nr:hypothetical protein LL033_14615 [Clostridium estertheticum]